MGALDPGPERMAPTRSSKLALRRAGVAAAFGGFSLAAALAPALVTWQQMGERRALSLANMKRVATGLLLYTQDWDGRLMPPAVRSTDASSLTGWVTWPEALKSYVSPVSAFVNPENTVSPFRSRLRDPQSGCPVNSSFALNRRFWSTFAPGPFPFENLELPEQTCLCIEAGPFWRRPLHATPGQDSATAAVGDYGDTTDRILGLVPYPSTHDGRMAVVAADGHGLIVTVEHYSAADGPHDSVFGRIGGGIYNWNGGRPNGETDRAPRD